MLSKWPLGVLGSYYTLSGTSMATPYLAASCALVKSQFPTATIKQIKDKLQTNASPVPQHCYSFRNSSTRSWSAQRLQCHLFQEHDYARTAFDLRCLKDRLWNGKHHNQQPFIKVSHVYSVTLGCWIYGLLFAVYGDKPTSQLRYGKILHTDYHSRGWQVYDSASYDHTTHQCYNVRPPSLWGIHQGF